MLTGRTGKLQNTIDRRDSVSYYSAQMVIEYIKHLLGCGWTQRKIAEESGIPQPNINRLLKGRQKDVRYTQGKRLEVLAASEKRLDQKSRRK